MKTWVHTLGSMRIAVVLLCLLVVALAAGTIVESSRGSEAAALVVYGALWFRVLLGLFAANVLFSLVDLWPWGRQRVGFVLTHGSMLLILAGALVTDRFKQEGRLAVWEGEQKASYAEAPAPGSATAAERPLPFAVRLDAFEIDYYQGTHRPAMFRSRVTVSDAAAGLTFPAIIEMNRPLVYGGFHLFQSSYQQGSDRNQSVLLVSRDPGQPIVFAGYTLLMAGMATVLFTRIVQRRALARVVPGRPAVRARRAASVLLGLGLLGAAGRPAAAATLPDAATAEALRRLPVQHDGRIMPLDTLAREAVRQVTGVERYRGIDPVALVLGWTFDPDGWADTPLVRLGDPGLAAALDAQQPGAPATFNALVRGPRLRPLLESARAAADADRPLTPAQAAAQKLEERLVAMQGFLNGSAIAAIPPAGDPRAPWLAPSPLRSASDLTPLLAGGPAARLASPAAMEREVTYNRVRPTRLSWWILGGATLVALAARGRSRRGLDAFAGAGLLLGFATMTWGLAMRWIVAGRIPASDMYESLLFLGWGVALFALVAILFLRNRLVVLNATAMSALTMALADLLPLDPFIHPMPPVLSGTPWLAIHVPIIMLSYSVLALGVLVAHMQIGVQIFAPARRETALRMNDLLYWYTHVGSILLIAGILTGSIWASSSWGRYWGWDPKEVWSLVAFLAYLAILHGRFDRLIGVFGVAALSIVAFWTILMTYIGVNFVLSAGLHSYGFGGSGVVRSMLVVGAVEGLFLAVGLVSHLNSPWRRDMAPARA